jgi:hypothetical protein
MALIAVCGAAGAWLTVRERTSRSSRRSRSRRQDMHPLDDRARHRRGRSPAQGDDAHLGETRLEPSTAKASNAPDSISRSTAACGAASTVSETRAACLRTSTSSHSIASGGCMPGSSRSSREDSGTGAVALRADPS